MSSSTDQLQTWLRNIAESTLGKIGTQRGFHVHHSGGGCHHFKKENEAGAFVLVCAEAEIPETDPELWSIALHDDEGYEADIIEYQGTLEQALDTASKLLMEA